MKNTLPWMGSNHRPRPVCRTNPTSYCTLPTELHGIPYIFIPHTSSWQPHQPTVITEEPIRAIGLAIRILYYSFSMLLCKATIQPSIPTTSLGLTLLPICPAVSQQPKPIPWVIQIRKLPRFFRLYSRIGYRLFPLHLR